MAKARDIKSDALVEAARFFGDFVSLPESSRPAGSVALDFTCDLHGGRLIRLWMSPHAGGATFGAEGVEGAWETDTSGRGAVLVTCISRGCDNSARLTNDWLVTSLRQVWADFKAGRSLPIAWFPLSKVGVPSNTDEAYPGTDAGALKASWSTMPQA